MKHLVIIGNGITGATVARNVRKHSDIKITMISAESDHLFSRTALMYIFMGHMTYRNTKPYEDWFWSENRINLLRAYVNKVDPQKKRIFLDNGEVIDWDILVIATGSKSNKFGWPGQDLPGVQGLYSLQDLDLLEENTKNINRAVLVGGGLIGVEMAEMLASRNIPVTFLVREENFWDIILPEEESKIINRHILEHGIDLRLSTELKEILPGENGRVQSVLIKNGEEIQCQLVGLTVGVHPNIDLIRETEVSTNRGVLVNEYLETNFKDVYAAGDCAEISGSESDQNRIEQLWYTGKGQGQILANTICGKRTRYQRGVWFNSAKFFDIEYQTYGYVHNKSQPDENSLYWQDIKGRKSVRIVYKKDSGVVTGFNLLGIRYRQKVCERWIKENQSIDYVLSHLREANFDPEFFKQYEADIIELYNNQNPGKNIQLRN